ncbi:hypothetical protein pb186bvf_017683 [Paramecium bursaria]
MYNIRQSQFNGFSEELKNLFYAILDTDPQNRSSAELVLEFSFCDQDSCREISILSMSPKFLRGKPKN